ncbi:hypothetical protein VUR80DRAFT_3785 [Thermomyces stellatus]
MVPFFIWLFVTCPYFSLFLSSSSRRLADPPRIDHRRVRRHVSRFSATFSFPSPISSTKERSNLVFPLVDLDTTQLSSGMVAVERAAFSYLLPFGTHGTAFGILGNLERGILTLILSIFFWGALTWRSRSTFIHGLRRSKACPETLVTAKYHLFLFDVGGEGRENARGERGMTAQRRKDSLRDRQQPMPSSHPYTHRPDCRLPSTSGSTEGWTMGASPRPRAFLSPDKKTVGPEERLAWGEPGIST